LTIPENRLKECHELLEPGTAFDETVSLTFDQRRRSRIRVKLKDCDLAWFLPRGRVLRNGDVLLCSDGYRVRVDSASEPVSRVDSEDGLQLSRLAYHLGNRHVSLQIGDGWLQYLRDDVFDEMVRELGGSPRSESAGFEPEPGAYHAHGEHHEHH
jgi:urease accessory protein